MFLTLPIERKLMFRYLFLGELKNPGKSIPRGTLSAMTFTFVVYISIALLTAATCSKKLMQNDYLFMIGISVFAPSVTIGLLTTTWSAALSTVIGASRVLEALSKDRIFGKGNPLLMSEDAFVVSYFTFFCNFYRQCL